jgi:lysophospholipase L1-like esterase
MEANSRRKFIKGAALTGVAACCLPGSKSFAAIGNATHKHQLKDGAVILFQGDSITDGNRGRDKDPNHIMGHGYAFSIASRVGADRPEKNYQFYNRGISANKVIDLEKRWQTDTLDLKPDVLSILIGVNDSASSVVNWDPVVNVQLYEEIYNRLLEQTRAAFPEVIFVLGEPFIAPGTRTTGNWEAYLADIAQRQAVVKKLASKYDAVFVGYQAVFDKAYSKVPADYWIWDGVHPTVAGHELMVREWLKEVGKRISF